MFEAVPQELKEQAEKVLRSAAEAINSALTEAEDLLVVFREQLNEWADELSEEGGSENITHQDKYDYLLVHGNEVEKRLYSQRHIKAYLLGTTEVLDSLYESKKNEVQSNKFN